METSKCIYKLQICNQKCCDEEKCTLKGQCAYGDCCEIESCTLKRTSHLCRPKTLEVCDIEEYCNGESSVCPVNTYVQDGTKCETNGVSQNATIFLFFCYYCFLAFFIFLFINSKRLMFFISFTSLLFKAHKILTHRIFNLI